MDPDPLLVAKQYKRNPYKKVDKKYCIDRRERKSKANVKYWQVKAAEIDRNQEKTKRRDAKCEVCCACGILSCSSRNCVAVVTGPILAESNCITINKKLPKRRSK